jgi:hypothetical protein
VHGEAGELLVDGAQDLLAAGRRGHGAGEQHRPAAGLDPYAQFTELAGGEAVLEVGDAVVQVLGRRPAARVL